MDYRNGNGNNNNISDEQIEDRDRRRTRTRNNMEQDGENNTYMMHGQKYSGSMSKSRMKNRGSKADEGQIEELYDMINERMCMAMEFHSQLADYFCFLGLQGFKRMSEYQFMKECEAKRKMHRRYIDHHHRILPVRQVEMVQLIPSEWSRYTTEDIDDSVIPRFVKAILKEWYEWEKETKEIYEEICDQFQGLGKHADCEFVKDLITDAEKECKKIMRLYEKLNGTGYDAGQIHQMQDKYHEKYKKKYEDHFTMKNNYRISDEQIPEYPMRRRRIGYV